MNGISKTVTICRWHDTIYKKPSRLHQKVIEPIHEFSKVARYKINIWKSVAFLYTNNPIRKTNEENNSIYGHIKKNKILKNRFKQGVVLWKLEDTEEIEDDTNKWKAILCSWMGRINIVKISTLPKQSIDSMQYLS